RPRLLALQVAALLVLLTACANAGLLLLLRASGRGREMGVRRALGAGTGRLAMQLFGEGAILALLSGLVGIALGQGALTALGSVVEARIGRSVPGGTAALHLDGMVLATVAGLGALMTVAFGAAPLWAASRQGLARWIPGGGRGATEARGTHRARGMLVAVEIALSLTLLSGGALMVRSALHLQSVELGFSPTRLEAYSVGFTSRGAGDPQRRIDFFRALEERTSELSGVESAALARSAPLTGQLTTRRIEVEGAPSAAHLPEAVPQIVSPGFFRALGTAVVRGRSFTPDDGPGTTPVAVVSASLASTLRPDGGDPLGARIRFPAWTMPEMAEEPGPWLT
ncbi:MAG TPA: FtsX-like permease family protein, partial [Longimicrobiales bacterium]|nr:FtsX-like permease family protein [Longimicrobiales bacterium]